MAGERYFVLPRYKDGCVLSGELKVEGLGGAGEEGAVEVSPCASERGKVMVEVDLSPGSDGPFLDAGVLCGLLRSYGDHFAEMKCSDRLGVARIKWRAYRIYIYEGGKFKIRFAHSREDALRMLNDGVRLVLGSVLCDECGRPAIECALGGCGVCIADEPPRALEIEGSFNGPLLMRAFEHLRDSLEAAEGVGRSLLEEGETLAEGMGEVEGELREAIESAISFTLHTGGSEWGKAGVLSAALAWNNLSLLERYQDILERLRDRSSEEGSALAGDLTEAVWGLKGRLVGAVLDEGDRSLGEVSDSLEIIREIRGLEVGGGTPDGGEVGEDLRCLERHVERDKRFLERISK